MDKPLTHSDIYDVNKTTGALVIGTNRLDDYATIFLNKYCAEALTTPMALPIDEMLKAAKLTVETAPLSKNLDIFGCCLLLDGYVNVYYPAEDKYVPTFYKAGTLLFDPNSEWIYGEGCKRNTLIHEMVHWDKDHTYFQILQRKNRKAKEQLYPIMCRQSRANYEPPYGKRTKQNEVEWLEWQAHRLAPRILMPKDMFRKKAEEYLSQAVTSCDKLVDNLSKFFIVSRASTKLRIRETGLESRITAMPDYEAVFAEFNQAKDFVPLTVEEAFRLLSESTVLENWIKSHGLVFVDGYFVIPDKKYLSIKNGTVHLTKAAKSNLPVCAVNIREQRFINYTHYQDDLFPYSVLYRLNADDIDQRILMFSPRLQSQLKLDVDKKEVAAAFCAAKDNLVLYEEEIEKGLLRRIGDEDISLCQCLWYMIEQRGWGDPLTFYEHTNVHENYYGRIRDNKANKMKSDLLMAICVGLGLRFRLTEKVYGKSEMKLHYYEEPDKTRIRIMETFPGIDITTFNCLLKEANQEPLGTRERAS